MIATVTDSKTSGYQRAQTVPPVSLLRWLLFKDLSGNRKRGERGSERGVEAKYWKKVFQYFLFLCV